MDARTSATSSDSRIDYATRVRAIAPLIAAASPHREARRQLTEDVLDLLHDADLFRLILSIGGGERDLRGQSVRAPVPRHACRLAADPGECSAIHQYGPDPAGPFAAQSAHDLTM